MHRDDSDDRARTQTLPIVVAALSVLAVAVVFPPMAPLVLIIALLGVPSFLIYHSLRARRDVTDTTSTHIWNTARPVHYDRQASLPQRLRRAPKPEPVDDSEPWRSERWIEDNLRRGLRQIDDYLDGPTDPQPTG